VQWLNEAEVLRAPSLGWATSLLDLVLAQRRGVALAAYAPAFVEALITYLRSPGLPRKDEVVRRLTALLRQPHMFVQRAAAAAEAGAGAGAARGASATGKAGAELRAASGAAESLTSELRRFAHFVAAQATSAPPAAVTGGVDLGRIRQLEAAVSVRVLRHEELLRTPVGETTARKPRQVPVALQELAELCATSRTAEQAMAQRASSRARTHIDRRTSMEQNDRTSTSVISNLAALRQLAACILGRSCPPDEWLLLIGALGQHGRRAEVGKVGDKWLQAAARACSRFGGPHDEAIIRLAAEFARTDAGQTAAGRSATSALDLAPSLLEVLPDRKDLYPHLSTATLPELRCRFALLQLLNLVIARCIDFVALVDDAHTRLLAADADAAPPSAPDAREPLAASPSQPSASDPTLWPLGMLLRRLGGVVLSDTKSRLVEEAIDSTWERPAQPPMTLTLDNALAFQSVDAGITDCMLSSCVFMQAADRLMLFPVRRFRERLDRRERLFIVSNRGEQGVDWGGLYREALTRAVEDIFPPAGADSAVGAQMADSVGSAGAAASASASTSGNPAAAPTGLRGLLASLAWSSASSSAGGDAAAASAASAAAWAKPRSSAGTALGIDLFLPCPNARAGAGAGQDKFLPNPRHSGPRQLRLFEFAGRLMGISMRQRLFLPFELPSLVWRVLAEDEAGITVRDVAEFDVATASLIDKATLAGQGRGPMVSGLCFSVQGSDGSAIELVPGGETTPVTTREDSRRWAMLALRRRVTEFDAQLQAMRVGLLGVIPQRAVRLCSWSELEEFVCGDARIDVELLLEHTELDGYSMSDRPVRLLFRCLRGMHRVDRARFIRFVWGRSRLPRGNSWARPFKITRHFGDESALPVAHSCFFQLDLPPYSTLSILRRRIMAALDYGMDSFLLA
jgi:hypothetical protein